MDFLEFQALLDKYVTKIENFNETKRGRLYNIEKYGSVNADE
jgi:hypothetical protein